MLSPYCLCKSCHSLNDMINENKTKGIQEHGQEFIGHHLSTSEVR